MVGFRLGAPDPIDENLSTLESMTVIINREARQRQLEGLDDYDAGHPLGICCDKCLGKGFRTFGVHKEERKDAPGFMTIVYMKCMSCGEMIVVVHQTTNFVRTIFPENPDMLYKPDWNMLAPNANQITRESVKRLDQLERISFDNANKLIDWM